MLKLKKKNGQASAAEKKKALSADTSFFGGITGCFKGPGIFECTDGFSKTFRMTVPDGITNEEWHDDCTSLLSHKCRFFVWNEEETSFDLDTQSNSTSLCKIIYVVMTVKADVVDDTIEIFENAGRDLHCKLEPLSYADTMHFITVITGSRVNSKDRITSAAPKFKEHAERLEFENGSRRIFGISGFPGYVFPALVPELLRLSSGIHASIDITPLDIDLCLAGAKKDTQTPDRQKLTCIHVLEKAARNGERLYSVGAYFCIDVNTTDEQADTEIENVMSRMKLFAKKFGLTINDFYGQQKKGYHSFFPYGVPELSFKKMLTGDNIEGMLPWSPLEKIESGCTYGMAVDTRRIVQIDRFLLHANGFILGSDADKCVNATCREIESISAAGPCVVITKENDKRFEAAGIGFRSSHLEPGKFAYWHTDPEKNRELLRILIASVLSNSKNREKVYNDCSQLASSQDIGTALLEHFEKLKSPEAEDMRAFIGRHKDFLSRRSGAASMDANTLFYLVTDGEDSNVMYTLLCCALYNKLVAKSLYIMNAETVLKVDPAETNPALTTYVPAEVKKFYSLSSAKDRLTSSGFLLLLGHATQDRLQLVNMLDLEKTEIKAMGAGRTVLITGYSNYIIE